MKKEVFILESKGHKVFADNRQFIIYHHKTCRERGMSADKYRTYTGYWLVESELAICSLALSISQFDALKRKIKEHEQIKCGFLRGQI